MYNGMHRIGCYTIVFIKSTSVVLLFFMLNAFKALYIPNQESGFTFSLMGPAMNPIPICTATQE